MIYYGDNYTFLYVDDIRTSPKTQASTAFYEDTFTFLYVDDICTSLKTHAFTACYGGSFTSLHVDDVLTYITNINLNKMKLKNEALPVAGRRALQVCKT
jgi:hypothetical protein